MSVRNTGIVTYVVYPFLCLNPMSNSECIAIRDYSGRAAGRFVLNRDLR